MTAAGVLLDEVRQSWRGLLRRPGYLALAVLTLALGVAATTAVFALLDKALFQPLPYPQSERLVTAGVEFMEGYRGAAPGFRTALARAQGLESLGLAAAFARNTNIASGDSTEVVGSLLVDRGFLDTLGLPVALGRNFNADEDQPNGPRAVILTHGFWQRHFGGDPAAVGSVLQVEGRATPVVGVLPADFQWHTGFDVMLPMQVGATSTNMATNEVLVARMRPGSGVASVSAEVEPLLRAAYADQLDLDADDLRWLQQQHMGALPLIDLFTQRVRTLWMFFAAAACVLLIAAINLANLMLLRALARSHDAAVRAALGAPPGRLALPALGEGLLVGATGALAGLALGWAGLRLFGRFVSPELLRGDAAGLTASSVGFALMAALAVALLGALLGVWRGGGHGHALARELVGGGRAGWSRSAGRLGRGLVVAQVAVAVVLLIGAGLFAHSLQRLLSVPMGFESRDVLTFRLAPVREDYPDLASTLTQTRRLLDGFERLPGVEVATMANVTPTAGQFNMGFELADGRAFSTQYRLVGPGYDDVLGLPLLAGRALGVADREGGEPVAVVNAEFARAHFDGDALGRTVRLALDGAAPMRIVGVVGDTRQFGPAQAPPAIVYAPFAQAAEETWSLVRGFIPLNYMLRLHPGSGVGESEIRAVLAEVAPTQPIAELQTMDTVIAVMTGEQRLNLLLVGVFAALALLLAGVGLYAVMAVAVEARRHEFGVRAALGAPPGRLLRQVLREGALQVAIGLGIGLAAALAMSRLLQGFLFDIGATDPLTIAGVLLVLAATGVLASLVPGLRAARVSPMQALRMD